MFGPKEEKVTRTKDSAYRELHVIQVMAGGGGIPSTQRYYRRSFYYSLLLKLLHVSVVQES
jgi:hypothetical protein